MSEVLPGAIVAPVEALGQALAAVAQAHRDETLASLEAATLDTGRAALPGLLGAVLAEGTSSLRPGGVGRTQRCPACGARCRVAGWRERAVTTVCGTVRAERPWYHCKACRHGWSPTDRTWGLGPRERSSAGLVEWLIDLGGSTSFADAKRELAKLTGLEVSAETIRPQTEGRGMDLEEVDATAAQAVQTTRAAAETVERAPGTLVGEIDGVMVRYHSGWHEVKLALVGGQVDGELRALSYVGAREPPEAFGPRVVAEAARRGALEIGGWEGPRESLARLRRVVLVADGAVWIWLLADEHFGERIEIVDFYHAATYVGAAAHAVFGEGTAEADAWAHPALTALRDEGPASLLARLAELVPPTPDAAETLREVTRYVQSHRARMDYPPFQAQGLPLGSGGVASAAKHLVQLRLKRAGARWSDDGAKGVLAVRCRLVSNRSLAA